MAGHGVGKALGGSVAQSHRHSHFTGGLLKLLEQLGGEGLLVGALIGDNEIGFAPGRITQVAEDHSVKAQALAGGEQLTDIFPGLRAGRRQPGDVVIIHPYGAALGTQSIVPQGAGYDVVPADRQPGGEGEASLFQLRQSFGHTVIGLGRTGLLGDGRISGDSHPAAFLLHSEHQSTAAGVPGLVHQLAAIVCVPNAGQIPFHGRDSGSRFGGRFLFILVLRIFVALFLFFRAVVHHQRYISRRGGLFPRQEGEVKIKTVGRIDDVLLEIEVPADQNTCCDEKHQQQDEKPTAFFPAPAIINRMSGVDALTRQSSRLLCFTKKSFLIYYMKWPPVSTEKW